MTCLPAWIQVAVEFRHNSWLDDTVFRTLIPRVVCFTISGAGPPYELRATAPFVYVRLPPDDHHLYAGSYSEDLHW